MSLLSLNHLKNKYSMIVNHIVHVGAHKGQEVEDYKKNFEEAKLTLFEPQLKLFQYLQANFGNDKSISLYNIALGSSSGYSKMFISDNEGESSSFYKPKHHLVEYPEINFTEGDATFEIVALDDLDITNIDLLNIDTQGYEMEVLKGAISTLSQDLKYIIVEVNKKEAYEGCPQIKDIDIFLKKYNFIRTDTHFWADSHSWGDGFYIKKELIGINRYLFSSFKKIFFTVLNFYINPSLK